MNQAETQEYEDRRKRADRMIEQAQPLFEVFRGVSDGWSPESEMAEGLVAVWNAACEECATACSTVEVGPEAGGDYAGECADKCRDLKHSTD